MNEQRSNHEQCSNMVRCSLSRGLERIVPEENQVISPQVPEPPWRSRSKRARRQVLDRDRIIDVALQIIDSEGVDGLSMRRIAEELDTGPASLYAHVSRSEERRVGNE